MLQKPYTAYEWCEEKDAGCWGRRSGLERKLIFLVVFVSAVLAVVIFSVVFTYMNDFATVCSTPGCIIAASQIIKHVDPDVDPCEDFFRFSCGRHLENSDGSTSLAAIWTAKREVKRQLDDLYKEPSLSEDPPVAQFWKSFFSACMDEEGVEEEGLRPLEVLLKEMGGWPVVEGDSWDNLELDFDWRKMSANHRRLGLNSEMFIFMSPEGDIEGDQNGHILYINAAYVEEIAEEDRERYLETMIEVAMMLGAERHRAEIEMRKTLSFMVEFREVSEKHIRRQQMETEVDEDILIDNILEMRMTVDDFQERYPYIDWLSFINEILDPVMELSNTSYVQLIDDLVLHDVFRLINRTPKRVQANYAVWQVITDLIYFLPKAVRELQTRVQCAVEDNHNRFEFCKKRTERSFLGLVVQIMYARKHINREGLKDVEELVDNVKKAFVDLLKEASWMDEESKNMSVEKVQSIEAIIGAPEEVFDDGVFEQFSVGLEEPYSSSLLEMALRAGWLGTNFKYVALNQTVKERTRVKFYSWISEVNAAYSLHDNIIMIKAGILKEVFYASGKPNYLNYGSLGYIVGHEFSHALDKTGSSVDHFGNELDIWTNTTRESFQTRTECIIKETEDYEIEGTDSRVNGSQTLDEDISDYNGLKLAYLAYERWVQAHKEESKLAVLEYTPLQLFWISAVAHYCYEVTPEKLEKKIKTETHAPSFLRAYGSIRNSEYFAADFGCEVGSRMNPADKCIIY